jgi:hypothetical protein
MTNDKYGERMMRIETKMDSVEKKIDAMDIKLESFINRCDDRYFTKKEACAMEKRLREYDKRQDNKWKFIANNWFSILLFLAFATYIILKYSLGVI